MVPQSTALNAWKNEYLTSRLWATLISPTFIKILIDHAISQTRPFINCTFFYRTFICFFAASFRLFFFLFFRMNNDMQQQEKGKPGNEKHFPETVHADCAVPDTGSATNQEHLIVY